MEEGDGQLTAHILHTGLQTEFLYRNMFATKSLPTVKLEKEETSELELWISSYIFL